MTVSRRQEVEAILAGARAEHAALLDRLSPELRASLPVDATGITQAIEHLGAAAGVAEDLHAAQAHAHRANPAVLHGRVFGRAPLSRGTVVAAFVEGARVRAATLERLADRVGGEVLRRDVDDLLRAAPSPADEAPDAAGALRALYDAHERAALAIAAELDAGGG